MYLYIAQYKVNTNDHSTFLKDVFFIEVSHFIEIQLIMRQMVHVYLKMFPTYLRISKVFNTRCATILKCLERVRALDFASIKKMPIDAHTHHFDEVTYKVDGLNVKALMMTPVDQNVIQRIVIYLRGGKDK